MLKKLYRTRLPKLSRVQIEDKINSQVNFVRQSCDPEKIIVFGSALSADFDELSDIDLVIVFPSDEEARQASKRLYREKGKPSPADYLCIGRDSYAKKSATGGVYFVAKEEGRIVYERLPNPGQ